MTDELNQTISEAIKIKQLNNKDFVTIWKTGKLYAFNFDKQEIGYQTKDYGVKRTVIGVY